MSYKSFDGKQRWQAFGNEPIISILSTGLICFNKACYDRFVLPVCAGHADSPAFAESVSADKPSGCAFVKLYYDGEAKSIAFRLLPEKKIGEFVIPIKLIKTGLIAIIQAKTFLNDFGVKYRDKSRSYLVYEIVVPGSSSGYQHRVLKPNGIEIRLNEYLSTEPLGF